jgi:hypothetical protein
VKCNLCQNTPLNPPEKAGRPGVKRKAYSCEENCPTGALLRVDPHVYFAEIKEAEGTIFRDPTPTVARHTSHKDFGKRLAHGIGLLTTLLLTLLTLAGLSRYGLETPLIGSWLDVRWLTGIVGLAGIAGVMAYPVRRKIYRSASERCVIGCWRTAIWSNCRNCFAVARRSEFRRSVDYGIDGFVRSGDFDRSVRGF